MMLSVIPSARSSDSGTSAVVFSERKNCQRLNRSRRCVRWRRACSRTHPDRRNEAVTPPGQRLHKARVLPGSSPSAWRNLFTAASGLCSKLTEGIGGPKLFI